MNGTNESNERLPGYGQGLAYPDWLAARMPWFHEAFNAMNRWLTVPVFRAGLGKYMANPWTGYVMVLRTRGRKSGEMRDAPVGYAIIGDAVYCIAGFGVKTNWYRNVLADPKVEVILPSRAFSGIAEEVTAMDEKLRVLPPLLGTMGPLVAAFGLGNPKQDSAEEIVRKCEGMPLLRIRPTGLAAGPEDPGGWFWAVPAAASVVGLVWLARRLTRG
jgi:deazaflavin-dependent oxidoreductase (nitroreductase family)